MFFCAKHALEMALMPESFWTTNIRGIHLVTLSVVKAETNKRQMFVIRAGPTTGSDRGKRDLTLIVTVKAPPVEDELDPPTGQQDYEAAGPDPSISAASQALAVAGALLGAGHLPMRLSCLIQRGAFFFALMAA